MGSGASSCCNFSKKKSFNPSETSKPGSFRSVSSDDHDEFKVEVAEDTNFMSNNDIEKQPLLSYAEAAALRPTSPQTMWDIVEKTCIQDSSGTLDSVQNRRGWKTIRLFVSSTFRDFHAEREVLVKEVFPDLRLWCEERKLHLVECDLRWGVPKDSTTEETVRICLEEIDRCYKDNVMPYFLNLTCGRSGWVPDFGDLTDNLAVLYGWVYGLSLTEMEIVHGAFRKCNPNALFMIRDDTFCDHLPNEVKDAFVDQKNHRKPAILKDVLKGKFPAQNIAYYEVECDPKNLAVVEKTKDERELKFKGLDSDSVFCKTVFNFFKERIAHQYPLDPTPEDPLEAQRKAHESFVDTRSQVVLGRDKIISEIESYIEADTGQAPLLLVGNAGSGKSAIMARIASNALIKGANKKLKCPKPKVGWKVFFHFVGATPGSTDLAFFLQRLTRELGYSKTDVASDLDSLIQMANSLLSNANTKPAIIIVDAINQLDEDKIHFLPRWLPEVLSPNVRVIMSMIDQTECHRMVRAYKSGPKEIICGELDYNSRQAIVENILRQYSKRLDEHQMGLLLKKEGSANPLWLTLACEELRVFGHFNQMDEKIMSLKDGLISLEEQLLMRFEKENGGPVVIATMCLLETSRHGLLETELLEMLADENTLVPPEYNEDGTLTAEKTDELEAPRDMNEGDAVASKLQKEVDETYVVKKDEDEDEEKTKKKTSKKKTKKFLSAAKWALVYRALKPLLRPCGDLGEGRFDFYHRSISKAVRKRYFSGSDGFVKHQYAFWHGRNAEYFESCDDYDRKSEELPYHLEQLLDHNRLTRCLLDWEIFQRLYSEDFSIDLLSSWQKAGGYTAASLLYKESLDVLKTAEVPLEEYAKKMEMVINFLIQAGQYEESYNLLNELIKIEENELGARTDKMADIYHLMTKTKSEIVKNHNFITIDQLEDDKEIVEIAKKSLSYRNQLEGEEHEHKKASLGIIITHHLGIVADLDSKNGAQHRAECFQIIDESIAIFKKLGDYGLLADALMTKTFINPRQAKYFQEKLEMLMEAFDLCTKAYGTKHMLVLRLYLNIGILYEDNGDYQKAYDYFIKWNKVCMEVLGPSHPKAKRSTDTLQEPMYKRIREQRERQAAGTA